MNIFILCYLIFNLTVTFSQTDTYRISRVQSPPNEEMKSSFRARLNSFTILLQQSFRCPSTIYSIPTRSRFVVAESADLGARFSKSPGECPVHANASRYTLPPICQDRPIKEFAPPQWWLRPRLYDRPLARGESIRSFRREKKSVKGTRGGSDSRLVILRSRRVARQLGSFRTSVAAKQPRAENIRGIPSLGTRKHTPSCLISFTCEFITTDFRF